MELWILIPLAAIAVGAFEQWLKFKAKQDKLGTSTAQLEGVVDDLKNQLEESEATRERLEQRIQNLETIVTTQMWDVVQSGAGAEELRQPGEGRLEIPDHAERHESQAAELAKKLRNM